MSKLTVIKQQYEAFEIEIEKEKLKLGVFTKTLFEDLGYLLSLLEEKDKAFERIIEHYNSCETDTLIAIKMLGEAQNALNTSSNNEGEN